MGIFARIGALLRSNINDLISKAEDPEKMLNQVLLDMQTQLVEAKKQVAVAIADEKRLKKQAEQEQAAAAEWERKAVLAVRAGNDALAREALARKAEHDAGAAQFLKQWEAQAAAVEKLKNALRMLNDKIEEAKRKKNLLIARQKRAEAQRTIQQTMSALSDTSALDTFGRMAERVDRMEAEAEAAAELEAEGTGDALAQRFEALEATAGTDDALAELKARMGLAPPAAAAAPALPPASPAAAGATTDAMAAAAELEELGVEPPKR